MHRALRSLDQQASRRVFLCLIQVQAVWPREPESIAVIVHQLFRPVPAHSPATGLPSTHESFGRGSQSLQEVRGTWRQACRFLHLRNLAAPLP